MTDQPVIFADALQEANIVHNVIRLRMGQVAAGGKLASAGTLIMPLPQLANLVESLNKLMQQVEQQNRVAPPQAVQQPAHQAAPQPAPGFPAL